MTTEIDRTRHELSRDVDALYDKVSPGRVVQRQKAAVRSRFSSVKESVMGSAHGAAGSAQDSAQGAAHSVQDAAHAVQGSAGSAVHAVERRTEGSPIGAGLVAFGAGMVLSALIPASQKEAEIAGRLTEAAKDSPLLDEAKAAGQEIGEHLKESATDAAQELRSSVQDSAENLKQEGQSATEEVRSQAPGQ